MKALLFFQLFLGVLSVHGQACKQVTLVQNWMHKDVLERFLKARKKDTFYKGEVGILIIHRKTTPDKVVHWVMTATIYNNFKDNPPQYYAVIGDCDYALIYDDDLPVTTTDKAALNECILCVVGQRIFDSFPDDLQPNEKCSYHQPGVEESQRKSIVFFPRKGFPNEIRQ